MGVTSAVIIRRARRRRLKVDSADSGIIFCMRRRKKVEGLTLDLTRIVEGVPFTFEDLIVVEPEPFVSGTCDACESSTIGALRLHGDKKLCGLCRAVTDGRISTGLCERLRFEYAKPRAFCGDICSQKHFDHVNMFSKLDSVGSMIERGCDEESIVTELVKCQILCKACHKEVSAHERRKGFFKKKKALNRRLRAGEDVEALRVALFEEYRAVLEPYYALRRVPHGN